jgi:transcriptional regulator with XRE-family HTH domain
MKTEITGPLRVRLVRDVVHYVKVWRHHRKLSLIALAQRTNKVLTPSAISQLENGKIAYTQSSLQVLAKALEVEPWRLLACPEPGVEADLWRIIARMNHPEIKALLLEYDSRKGQTLAGPEPTKKP